MRWLSKWRRDERLVLAACVAMAGFEAAVLYAFATILERALL